MICWWSERKKSSNVRTRRRTITSWSEIAFKWVLLVAGEATMLRVDLQQPVDGLGFKPCLLVHALCGAPRRCGECHSDALRRHDAQERVEAAGLSHPWSTGDHCELGDDHKADGIL